MKYGQEKEETKRKKKRKEKKEEKGEVGLAWFLSFSRISTS